MNQCAIELCGESSKVESAWVSDEVYENYYQDAATLKDYEAFKPSLQKYMDITRAKTQKEIQEILNRENFNKPEYFDLSSYSNEQITQQTANQLMALIFVEVIKDQNGKKDFTVSVMNSEVPLDDEIEKRYIESEKKRIQTDFRSAIDEGYLELEEAMLVLKDALNLHIAEVNKMMAASGIEDAKKEALAAAKSEYEVLKSTLDSSKDYTSDDLHGFHWILGSVDDELTSSLSIKYFTYEDHAFNCDGLKCREYLKDVAKNILTPTNLKKIDAQAKDEELAQNLIADCEYYWHQDKLNKSIPGKKEEFRKSIPNILDKVHTNFSSKFSKESASSLKKYLEHLKYVVADEPIPGSADYDMLEYLKQSVSETINPTDDTSGYQEPEYAGVLGDFNKVKQHVEMGMVNFTSELSQCHMADVTASDHFHSSGSDQDTYIHVSPYSCNHYTSGKQVLAHEIGHAISNQFFFKKSSKHSYEKFLEHRNCISNNYLDKDIAGSPMYGDWQFANDTKYTEEDMADFIAGIVYSNPNESLYSCALLKQDPNGVDFDRKELNVLNPMPVDSHSTGFLRVLKEAILKNRVITPSCQKVIDNYKDRVNFNKCEF